MYPRIRELREDSDFSQKEERGEPHSVKYTITYVLDYSTQRPSAQGF